MISFANVSKQYGRQVLFVDASFQLNPGEHLLGREVQVLRRLVEEENKRPSPIASSSSPATGTIAR